MTSQPILSQPNVRHDLISCLSELQADDPRAVWQDERQLGLASGIDEVFHFFFDDHDFDRSAVKHSLFDQAEVQSIEAVKMALEAILEVMGDAGDDAFISHPLWAEVRRAAAGASARLKDRF